MRVFLRAAARFAAVIVLFVLAGCGDAPPPAESSNTEATVSGVVKVDGVPASDGEVIFDPSNSNRPSALARNAPIGSDGKYTIKTLVGENQIRLGGGVTKKNQILQRVRKVFNVQSGDNTYDLDLKTN
jgi:hypothetical protein